MTTHVTASRPADLDRVVLSCARCGAGLVIDLPATAKAVADACQHFEREHRACGETR